MALNRRFRPHPSGQGWAELCDTVHKEVGLYLSQFAKLKNARKTGRCSMR